MTNTEQILASNKKWREIERKQTSKALRQIHDALIQKDPPPSFLSKYWPFMALITLYTIAFLLMSCRHSFAYTDEQAIRTIVGEASNQELKGMIAVGEVIRTRGSLKGFYGLKAKHADHEPKWVWEMAKKAWIASKTSNLTCHADHFENINDFGTPSWAKNCIITFRFKDHVFMKEVV